MLSSPVEPANAVLSIIAEWLHFRNHIYINAYLHTLRSNAEMNELTFDQSWIMLPSSAEHRGHLGTIAKVAMAVVQ